MKRLHDLVDAIDSVVIEAQTFPTTSRDPTVSANDATRAAGHQPIDDDEWLPLDTAAVHSVLAFRIGHDLAYSSDQLLPVTECNDFATALLAHADTDARWLTNRGPTIPYPNGGSATGSSPISDWTFDAAYVGVGSSRTLFICFFAED